MLILAKNEKSLYLLLTAWVCYVPLFRNHTGTFQVILIVVEDGQYNREERGWFIKCCKIFNHISL